MTEQVIHWTAYVAAIGPTLIGIGVAYIAYQQWRTNNDTLREKLFDRRMEVFRVVHAAQSEAVQETFVGKDTTNKLAIAYQQAHFLFRSDIREYIQDVRRKCLQLHKLKVEYDHDRRAAITAGNPQESIEICEWFDEQVHEGLWTTFAPYLSFRNRQ